MEEIRTLFKTAVEEIQLLLNTRTVVGESIVVDGKTLIPLVSMGFGLGVAGGRCTTPESKGDKEPGGLGGGTGGAGGMKPIGIIVVDENGVRFEPVKRGATSALERVVSTFAATRAKEEDSGED